MDLKQGIEELRRNRTLKYVLAYLLQVGNFLNGVMVSTVTHSESLKVIQRLLE